MKEKYIILPFDSMLTFPNGEIFSAPTATFETEPLRHNKTPTPLKEEGSHSKHITLKEAAH